MSDNKLPALWIQVGTIDGEKDYCATEERLAPDDKFYIPADAIRKLLLRYDDESNSCAADLEELLAEYEGAWAKRKSS